MAEISKAKPADIDGVLNQSKVMQDSNNEMMQGMQKMNMKNMVQQGMNNMFNAGIQTLSQSAASARDSFSAIGRNM